MPTVSAHCHAICKTTCRYRANAPTLPKLLHQCTAGTSKENHLAWTGNEMRCLNFCIVPPAVKVSLLATTIDSRQAFFRGQTAQEAPSVRKTTARPTQGNERRREEGYLAWLVLSMCFSTFFFANPARNKKACMQHSIFFKTASFPHMFLSPKIDT